MVIGGAVRAWANWAWTSRNTFLLKATGAEDIDHKAAQRKGNVCDPGPWISSTCNYSGWWIHTVHTAGGIAGLKNPVIYTNHCRQKKTVTTFVQPKWALVTGRYRLYVHTTTWGDFYQRRLRKMPDKTAHNAIWTLLSEWINVFFFFFSNTMAITEEIFAQAYKESSWLNSF